MSRKINDITVPRIINGVTIPPPTEADLQWATEIENKKSKEINTALDDVLTGDKNLWRIAFIINIPYVDTMFKSRGLSSHNRESSPNRAIEIGSIDIFKILSSKDSQPPFWGAICKALHSNHHDIVTYLNQNFKAPLINIVQSRGRYFVDNKPYDCIGLKAAVHSGNIDMIKLLVENGENLIQSGDVALKLTKSINNSEMYKYLKDKIDESERAFISEEPAPLLLTEEEDPWEKVDATSIAKHQFLEKGQAKISNIYDFEDGQIMTIYQKDGMPPSTPTFQNFDDIQKDNGITSAFNKLVSLDGNPKPYVRGQIDKKSTARVFKIND